MRRFPAQQIQLHELDQNLLRSNRFDPNPQPPTSIQNPSARTSVRSNIQSMQEYQIQIPLFIVQSPFLIQLINRMLDQFFLMAQFIGQMAICLYRFLFCIGGMLVGGNAILVVLSLGFQLQDFECMRSTNNGIMPLDKWMALDVTLSLLILILIAIHYYLLKKKGYNRRHQIPSPYLIRKTNLINGSWILLYAIKFFILNSIGSIQFFVYTYKVHPEESQQICECGKMLNIYLGVVVIYNYLNVVVLCVFVVERFIVAISDR